VTIEIRRFGVGHRRPEGPPGTVGLTGQPIHSDGRGLIAELAFARGARIEPHANPNTTWFVVIEGGGWVGVAEERTRVAAGEAVLWPANIPHTAWTEYSEMRAFVVEFTGPDDTVVVGLLEGKAVEIDPDAASPERRGVGALVERPSLRATDPESGEPA
jgi:quercetin dioxygenase-like cupin family protein